MLKKFQHDSDIAKVSIFDYGLWTLWLTSFMGLDKFQSAISSNKNRGGAK